MKPRWKPQRVKKSAGMLLIIALFSYTHAHAQEKIIDQVAAVVGQNIILESDIENQYYQYRMEGDISGGEGTVKCQILESMLFQNLLLNQAELDSVEITESQIEQTMDQRLRYFIAQIGSKEAFEEYYGKSIPEFKEEFRDEIKNQLMIESVQQGINQDVTISPSEVNKFFKSIPTDSLPLINSEVIIGQIVKKPPISIQQKLAVKEKLRSLRDRVVKGEKFSTLAVLYSEDPGSAKKGGELGLYGRGELYPEFEAVAFKLNKGEVSEIVETEAGFHILQLIERKGEYVNVRHILIRPKVSPEDLDKARITLDSVATLIRNDVLDFEEAVTKFSDDPGKNSGGLLINPMTGTTRFEVTELDPSVSFVIDKLKPGMISDPVPMETETGQEAYRLLYLKKRTLPHRANLTEDYNRIREWALQEKQSKAYNEWISKKATNTYIKIVDKYKDCAFENDWNQ